MGCILFQVSITLGLHIVAIRTGNSRHLLFLLVLVFLVIIGVVHICICILEVILFVLDVRETKGQLTMHVPPSLFIAESLILLLES